ncbi:MAG: Ig-like domain-containing protein, partial [Gammaproteobacteria bacterium]|nr:Ig-like domain-containing protein [Gammaproteobacteria bacterium]
MLGLVAAFTTACGGGNQGRDPILGTDGNAALAPTVIAVTPGADATGVSINTAAVTATFSQPMAPLTGDASFTLTCASPCTSPSGTKTLNAAGRTASLALDTALESSTTYTATVNGASLASGLPLTEPFTWTFTTAGPPPTVTAVAPVNNATGVAIDNTVITAQFSEPVTALASGDFTVSCDAPCSNANGVVSMNTARTIATFTVSGPAALEPQTRYTATIASATSSVTDKTLQPPFVWRFTTGVTPDTTNPRVILTEPPTTVSDPTTGVPTNTAVTARFSEDMDPLSVADTSFTLTCEAPCVSPSGAVSYVVGSRTAVFSPADELESGVTYTATVASSVTDLAGNRLSGNQGQTGQVSDYIWTFTTEVALPENNISVLSTDPMDGGSLAVCPVAGINATFVVPSGLRLDPNTVTSQTFRVVEDATPLDAVIADSVVVDADTGMIATFTPQDPLTEGVVYRAIVKAGPDGVKDLALPANELLEDFVWTFTAVAPVESCLQPVALNTAAPFGAFGGTAGITNQGLLTIINGDIGTTAVSTEVTGFVSEIDCSYTVTPLNEGQVNGRIFTSPPPPTVACPQDGTAVTAEIASQARLDAEAAFIALSPANLPGGQAPPGDGENLGGETIAPGVYTAAGGSFLIEGSDLTLDGQGNQNAVWVFQMTSTLTVGGPGAAFPQSVILINGAQAKNVFWQVGSAA